MFLVYKLIHVLDGIANGELHRVLTEIAKANDVVQRRLAFKSKPG